MEVVLSLLLYRAMSLSSFPFFFFFFPSAFSQSFCTVFETISVVIRDISTCP